jgi:hypothetical protein
VKKLIYLAVVALGLMATAAADGPFPADCAPNCPASSN